MSVLADLVAESKLHWSDYLVLILYFVAVIGVGIWVSLRYQHGSNVGE